jgi:hypothetical protein
MASRPLLNLVAAALLELLAAQICGGWDLALAAPGRKAKPKLQQKAPEIAASPPRLQSLAPPKRTEQSAEADLNEELEALALQVLPGKDDQSKRAEIFRKRCKWFVLRRWATAIRCGPLVPVPTDVGKPALTYIDMLVSAKENKTSKGKAVNALRKVADVGIWALKWRTFEHGPRCRS